MHGSLSPMTDTRTRRNGIAHWSPPITGSFIHRRKVMDDRTWDGSHRLRAEGGDQHHEQTRWWTLNKRVTGMRMTRQDRVHLMRQLDCSTIASSDEWMIDQHIKKICQFKKSRGKMPRDWNCTVRDKCTVKKVPERKQSQHERPPMDVEKDASQRARVQFTTRHTPCVNWDGGMSSASSSGIATSISSSFTSF